MKRKLWILLLLLLSLKIVFNDYVYTLTIKAEPDSSVDIVVEHAYDFSIINDRQFSVNVSFNNAYDIFGYQMHFNYDETKFKLVDLTPLNDNGEGLVYNVESVGDIKVNYSNISTSFQGNVELFTLVFEPLGYFLPGTTEDLLWVEPSNHQEVIRHDLEKGAVALDELDFHFEPMTFISPGDINQDGIISIIDVAYLQLHLAESLSLSLSQQLAGDLHDEGRVSLKDITALQLVIAGLREPLEIKGFSYDIVNDEAHLTRYHGTAVELSVPSHFEGYPVTHVAPYAFAQNRNIKLIEFPNTIVSIGDLAFANMISLESISFNGDLEHLGESVYHNTPNLKNAHILSSSPMTASELGLSKSLELTSVVLHNTSDSLKTRVFESLNYDVEVILADSFKSLTHGYFQGVSGISHLDLGTVTYLEEAAVINMPSLKTIWFPDSLVHVSSNAIQTELDYIYLSYSELPVGWETSFVLSETAIAYNSLERGQFLEFKYVIRHDQTIMITSHLEPNQGATVVPTIINQRPVTALLDYAFSKSLSLETLTIPNSISEVGSNLFYPYQSELNVYLQHEEIPEFWNGNWNNIDAVVHMGAENIHRIVGYVHGLQDGDQATVILSQGSNAYQTLTDSNGYYAFNHIPSGQYTLHVELQGYHLGEPVTIILDAVQTSFNDLNQSPFLLSIDEEQKPRNNTHVIDIEVIRFELGHFHYQWRYMGDYFGFAETSYVIPRETVRFLDEDIKVSSSHSSQALEREYNVLLSDEEVPWSSEYASRLLNTFDKIPIYWNTPVNQSSKWILTDNHLPNDIVINSHDEGTVIYVSSHAFRYAEPRLAEIEGIKGMFFSLRLYHAVVRFVTEEGFNFQAVEHIMNERFDVSLVVQDYAYLTRNTTQENEYYFQEFKPNELLMLLTMFEEMPPGLQKTPGLDYVVRRIDGHHHPLYPNAPAVAWPSEGYIEFVDLAFMSFSQHYMHRLIIHEISHFLWAHLFSDQLKAEWIELGGWYETDETLSGWATTKTTEFVSAYAHGINPDEDMAESIADYLTNPNILRSRSPNKYNFIRQYIMHGHTYRNEIREDLTFEVFNLYPNYDYPGKINRVTIDIFGLPEEDKELVVEIELYLQDHLDDGASYAITRIYSEIGTFFDLYLNPINEEGSILRGQRTLSRFMKNGFWKSDQIVVTDLVGNQRFEGVSHYGWIAYLDNPLEDITPPEVLYDTLEVEVNEIQIDGRTVYEVDVTFEIIEENPLHWNGSYASIVDANPLNYRHQSWGVCNVETNVCHVRFHFTDYHFNGDYKVNFLIVRDKALNSTNFGMTFAPDDPDPIMFSLDTKHPDTSPPELDLNRITITAVPTNPESPDGETLVTIQYYARDDASGLGLVSYSLLDPQGKRHHQYHYHENFYTLFFEGDPTVWRLYTINVLLPRGSAPGIWGLAELSLSDKAHNSVLYSFEEIIHFVIELEE